MRIPARVEMVPGVMDGKPCVKGTRIPVDLLLEKMAAGQTPEQLLAAYPQLVAEDLTACVEYAVAVMIEESLGKGDRHNGKRRPGTAAKLKRNAEASLPDQARRAAAS